MSETFIQLVEEIFGEIAARYGMTLEDYHFGPFERRVMYASATTTLTILDSNREGYLAVYVGYEVKSRPGFFLRKQKPPKDKAVSVESVLTAAEVKAIPGYETLGEPGKLREALQAYARYLEERGLKYLGDVPSGPERI